MLARTAAGTGSTALSLEVTVEAWRGSKSAWKRRRWILSPQTERHQSQFPPHTHRRAFLTIYMFLWNQNELSHCRGAGRGFRLQKRRHDTTQPLLHRAFYFSSQTTWNRRGNNSSAVIQLLGIKGINILISLHLRHAPTNSFLICSRTERWGFRGVSAVRRIHRSSVLLTGQNICQRTSSRTEFYQLPRKLSDLLWLTALKHT